MTKTTAAPYDWINIGVSSTSNTNAMTKMDYTFTVTDFSGDNCCVSNLAYNSIVIDQDWNTNYGYNVAGSTTGNVLTINLSMVLLPGGTPQNLSGTTDLLKIRFLVNPGCNLVIAMTKNEFTNTSDVCMGSPMPSNISITTGGRSVSGNIKMKVWSIPVGVNDENFVDSPINFNVTNGCCLGVTTDNSGNFSCNRYTRLDDVIITPNQIGLPSSEYDCGVNSDDISLAQSFILLNGNSSLSQYFQVIACDMNRNNYVQASDLNLMSIVVNNNTWPSNIEEPGYRYATRVSYNNVSSSYYGSPSNPILIDENYQSSAGSTPIDDALFYAIKMGDCDSEWCLSYDFNNFTSHDATSRTGSIVNLEQTVYKINSRILEGNTFVSFGLKGQNRVGYNSFSLDLQSLASKFITILANEDFAFLDYKLNGNILQGTMVTDAYFDLREEDSLFKIVLEGIVLETDIYNNIVIKDRVFKNLLILDGINFVPKIEVPETNNENIVIYPTILSGGYTIKVLNNNKYTNYLLTNSNGIVLNKGIIDETGQIEISTEINNGVLFLSLLNKEQEMLTKKIIKF